MDYGQLLAINIRKIRESLGMTQAELARRSGLTAQRISIIERHEQSPRVRSVLNIAAALGVQPADLFKRLDFDETVYLYMEFDEGASDDEGEGEPEDAESAREA